MELTTTSTSVNHQMEAEQDGYKLNASVQESDGVLNSVNGTILKDSNYVANFSAYKSGDETRLSVSDMKVEDASTLVSLASDMVASIKVQYES